MAKSLLLVTADNSFAQVLLYGLEQAGHEAYVVKGKGESVVRADEKNYNACSFRYGSRLQNGSRNWEGPAGAQTRHQADPVFQ